MKSQSYNKNIFKGELKPYRKLVEQINHVRHRLESVNEGQLKLMSARLKQQARGDISMDELLVDAFALACEVSRREIKLRPFDVQVAAAVALHEGKLAEMQTGEGKTLAAVLPVYLNALEGKGVHVLTFNDYLARRDAEWMGPIYRFLGLSVGYIREGMSTAERKAAYAADITYVTAREAGFDFLRDHRCLQKEHRVHRPFYYVVVDEADSILIDEARVPLVIAGETSPPPVDPYKLAGMVREMEEETDYCRDTYSRDVNYTDAGLDKLETILACGHLHDPENNQIMAASNLALQAEILLHRDIDYIVREGKVELVDEFTGRVADNRRYPYGLQTSIEAKEGLELQPEGIILGSITLQHLLELYPKIAGMTATAKTSEEEFQDFYGLPVVVIPPNRSCIRVDNPDTVFTHKEAKFNALVEEIKKVNTTGRPVLVGTASVDESERLAGRLIEEGVRCNVLNAKNDAAEAAIVAEAGALNAVTISTNMAGRGTDIRLGGKDQHQRQQVLALGGLYVIGTNRHESRRIDLQLRGRAGRQGDPGDSRFFISLEDDLMIRYRVHELIPRKLFPKNQEHAIHNPIVAREIARAQRIIEGQNFEIRKTLRNYSYMVEQQRKIIQQWREELLSGIGSSSLLAEKTPQRYEKLLAEVGSPVLENAEALITLFHIDQNWTEHLAYISHIKESIHLQAFGGKTPAVEFQKKIIGAFDEKLDRIEENVVETFNRVTITKDGLDVEKEGLMGPSSTWTYLINDMPFDNLVQQLLLTSGSFNSAAGLAMLPFLPIILIGRIIQWFSKKRRKGTKS